LAPANLQAPFERAEQALYANVRNLFGGRLRQAVTGAAPIAPSILEFFYACGVPVMEGYGMTETASVASVNTPDAFRLGSVGRPLPGVQVRIADEGEILIQGPNIFKGYYRDGDATRATLVDGWLHTGDLGRLDAEGYLHLAGRRGDRIIRGGENVYPLEVENVLTEHPAVADAVVVGVPDQRLGETVKAYVVPVDAAAPPDPDALRAFARERLAGFKVPAFWEFTDSLPRNANGKVLRAQLIARARAVPADHGGSGNG
jgi:acyl-CoA synthetase (AMP-forming)/AMP-acid ligase II